MARETKIETTNTPVAVPIDGQSSPGPCDALGFLIAGRGLLVPRHLRVGNSASDAEKPSRSPPGGGERAFNGAAIVPGNHRLPHQGLRGIAALFSLPRTASSLATARSSSSS